MMTEKTGAATIGHETTDVKIRPVLVAVALVVLLTVGTFLGMWILARVYSETRAKESPPANPLAATYGLQEPPAPRLQAHPRREYTELLAAANARLTSWGWVDEQRGVAHIPIERAIELLAATGLPHRSGTTGAPAAAPGGGTP